MASEVIPTSPAPVRAWPADVAELLGRVEQQLQAEGPRKALEALDRAKASGPWAANARAVCLLRLGEAGRALEVFRGLVQSGAGLRDDAPTAFKVNYATAQLLAGNLTGCIVTLGQTRDEGHPSVQRLRAALRRWRSGLSFWEKARSLLGFDVDKPVELGFPPGEL